MLFLEFAGLFFVLPSLLAWAGPTIPALAVLWAVSIPCFLFLRRDPGFNQRELWRAGPFPKGWTGVLIPFAASAAAIGLAVWYWAPRRLFDIPSQNPVLWVLILCLYPVFSVFPQGLVYRAFFERRYAALFREPWAMLVAGGVAFAYMHVVFRNVWAMSLSLPGGLLFFARYRETRSLLVSSVEHALYGCWIFTIGLGVFFYQGPMPRF